MENKIGRNQIPLHWFNLNTPGSFGISYILECYSVSSVNPVSPDFPLNVWSLYDWEACCHGWTIFAGAWKLHSSGNKANGDVHTSLYLIIFEPYTLKQVTRNMSGPLLNIWMFCITTVHKSSCNTKICSLKTASSVTFQNLLKLIIVDRITYVPVHFTKIAR